MTALPVTGSFRNKILLVVVSLLVVTLAVVFIAVTRASNASALGQVNADLDLTERAFRELLESRNQALLEKARFLSSDHAYRQIYGFGNPADLAAATENHRRRIAADLMILASMRGKVLAATSAGIGDRLPAGAAALLSRAMDSDNGEAHSLAVLADGPYQLVVVPLYAPDPVAMVILGFRIDETLALQLQAGTRGTEISLKFNDILVACTLAQALCARLADGPVQAGIVPLGGEHYFTRVLPLGDAGLAILQRSLTAELADYYRLRRGLAGIFLASLVIAVLAATGLARHVTRPLATLSEGVRRIADGDYSTRVAVEQRDEVGQLAGSFNAMAQGLEERARIRSLLGKVVSPQIADELLSRQIELGGEERVASVLFSDVRGFTELSEGLAPRQVITLLNDYLTAMNAVIESHKGVVDKYIGDAVMALFGAPLDDAGHAHNATRCAIEMQAALESFNANLATRGQAPIEVGIGINSGRLVAGNMGSATRLNYTVLGDTVNLASRIEGLCKVYQVPVIISEATHAACPDLPARELDRVRVKGRQAPVTLYQPLTAAHGFDLALHDGALSAFRQRDWRDARAAFEALAAQTPCKVYDLYLRRLAEFEKQPPPESWDGTTAFATK